MCEMEQYTVDSLKHLLDELSRLGYGDMPIFIGTNAPLLKDAFNINYMENKLTVRSRHYDRELANATNNLKYKIEKAMSEYFDETYSAGRNIKLDLDKVIQNFMKEENDG